MDCKAQYWSNILPKLIYRFNPFPIKMPASLLHLHGSLNVNNEITFEKENKVGELILPDFKT